MVQAGGGLGREPHLGLQQNLQQLGQDYRGHVGHLCVRDITAEL